MVAPAMQLSHGYYDNKSFVAATGFGLNSYALLMRKD
jgi:hypothetical protein